jgi:hypothetical protein
VDIVTLKELIGHSTIVVAMRRAHSNDKTEARAVKTLKSSDKVLTVVPRRRKLFQ